MSGAKSQNEYHDWSWSACGMACTKMILAHRTGKVVPIVTLGKKCAKYGGYVMPLKTSAGLYYKPYLTFVAKEFNWKAKIVQGITIQELMYELGRGNYVIASVSPQIRTPASKPKHKGGHLVVMLGYDKTRQDKSYIYTIHQVFLKKLRSTLLLSFAILRIFSVAGVL